jgi:hypothetical protein
MEPFDPKPILRALAEHGVEYVVVGGLAGMAHGSSYPSFDVDIVYARTPRISSVSQPACERSARVSAARRLTSRSCSTPGP